MEVFENMENNEKRRYIIPEWDHREEYKKMAKEWNAGFEYNDFFNPDVLDSEEEIERIVNGYLELERDRSQDTLHGAFYDLVIHSSDKKIKKLSQQRVIQSMDIARRLGVKAVIFHTNLIANFTVQFYIDNWIKENAKFWKMILKQYKNQSIYMENMFDTTPDILCKLSQEMEKEERFGVCFDYAHAAIGQTSFSNWLQALAPYIKHMHVNDNDLLQDLHLCVGEGKINWREYHMLLDQYHISPSVLVEVKGRDNIQRSIGYLKSNKIYPYE